MNISAPIVSRITLYRQTFDSPIGQLHCLATQDRVISVDFQSYEQNVALQRRLEEHLDIKEIRPLCNSVLEETRFWFIKYFSGRPQKNPAFVKLLGSDFEKLVWQNLRTIPAGEAVSYGEIARRISQPTASRAIGQACHRNPIGILVPCHRVVGSSGKLTGYAGGLASKTFLLQLEKNLFIGKPNSANETRVNLSQSIKSSIKHPSKTIQVA